MKVNWSKKIKVEERGMFMTSAKWESGKFLRLTDSGLRFALISFRCLYFG